MTGIFCKIVCNSSSFRESNVEFLL
ncbi:hypothetical protein LKM20_00440 [Bacillus wiedmannii]|nr:hypothetical protein [Bacillus wiedmannii]